jgi:hypothetical protein
LGFHEAAADAMPGMRRPDQAMRLLATLAPHNKPRKSKTEQTPGLIVGSMTECRPCDSSREVSERKEEAI